MSEEKIENSVKQGILTPELNFQEGEMLTENLEENLLGDGALTPAKGYYETVKEYTKEVPVYDVEGNVTGMEIVVTGRDVKWISTDEEELKKQRYTQLKTELAKIKEDIEQETFGLVRNDYTEKKARAAEIINELRVLEGKEPRAIKTE